MSCGTVAMFKSHGRPHVAEDRSSGQEKFLQESGHGGVSRPQESNAARDKIRQAAKIRIFCDPLRTNVRS